MSTALLKFHRTDDLRPKTLDASVLAAALSTIPEPLAIYEDSDIVYANPRFSELCRNRPGVPDNGTSPLQWQEIDFQVDHRQLSLRVPKWEGPASVHLALLGRMVGGVAHDFNNLLTGILLYCELLQTKFADANPWGKKLDEIRAAAEQGARLIRQLMSVGRENNAGYGSANLNRAINDLLPLTQHLAGENVRVSAALDHDAGSVGISLAQTEQVILNLVLNARDAMPGGGQITLATCTRECHGTAQESRIVELTVSDSGKGMDTKTASRVFEPFFTTKPAGRGTGLGLATVRKIVEEAGGMVCVETELGKGTRIIVRLPQVASEGNLVCSRDHQL
jgi:signal transduction histidine kinase